jgi:hypothetical protein
MILFSLISIILFLHRANTTENSYQHLLKPKKSVVLSREPIHVSFAFLIKIYILLHITRYANVCGDPLFLMLNNIAVTLLIGPNRYYDVDLKSVN